MINKSSVYRSLYSKTGHQQSMVLSSEDKGLSRDCSHHQWPNIRDPHHQGPSSGARSISDRFHQGPPSGTTVKDSLEIWSHLPKRSTSAQPRRQENPSRIFECRPRDSPQHFAIHHSGYLTAGWGRGRRSVIWEDYCPLGANMRTNPIWSVSSCQEWAHQEASCSQHTVTFCL